ncbi:MAG: pyruvate dehydrogenase complex dihydrolipoamide acetyltransferase [Saprospiraceae bacterium]|nr:pyruvate dehydrogenase complex dihydrolipoamide acetyltransferase [Saprospiraceae bacterium]
MAEVIKMPRLSDTMEEGNIVAWLKKVGDKVSTGDILAEVETDKATMDLESFQDGTLLYIGVEEGPVPVDGIIAILGEEGEDYKELLKSSEAEAPKKAEEVKTSEQQAPASPPSPTPQASNPQPIPTPSMEGGRVKASPLAKSIAAEAGIDLSRLTGTGENGRIIKKDVESFLETGGNGTATPAMAPIMLQEEVQYGDHPISQMRKTIARRLSESKFGAPHFYLTIEANMDETVRARKMANENAEIRISFNDIIVKACAAALRKHPAVNSSWLEDRIRINQDINIGVAVAVDEGLLVPVIRNADAKSLTYINQEVRALAGKAKKKKLQPDEMQGNTFTISNLGMFDIDEFTAIINPPDSCILAVGSIIQKPVVKNGEIVVGNMMKMTLSCDHRVVDGATGAQFLQTLKSMLENPLKILA